MTNNTTSINTNNIRTATYFTYDHFNKKIVGSEFNFKKSGDDSTPQYKALMVAMERHPNYTLSAIASKKKVEKKQSYKGLTSDLIREYVEIKGSEAQKAELSEMIDNDETYPVIKSWFLDYFKCGFSVEKAKNMIAYHKLNERKAKVRTAVRVKTVKAAPTVVEMPAANF